MPTDFEKTKALLESLGVNLRVRDANNSMEDAHRVAAESSHLDFAEITGREVKAAKYIKLGGGQRNGTPGSKLVGYGGFYSIYYFDAEGKFLAIGTWE